jgi:hypothetical protein
MWTEPGGSLGVIPTKRTGQQLQSELLAIGAAIRIRKSPLLEKGIVQKLGRQNDSMGAGTSPIVSYGRENCRGCLISLLNWKLH